MSFESLLPKHTFGMDAKWHGPSNCKITAMFKLQFWLYYLEHFPFVRTVAGQTSQFANGMHQFEGLVLY